MVEKRALLLFAAALVLCGCSGTTLEVLERKPSSFLERRGKELYLDGRPYRFLSFNAFTLTGCGLDGEVPDDAQLDAFFATLRPRSLVRTFALEAWGIPNVERVAEAARARGHLLTLVLGDDAGSCADGGSKKTEAFYASGFRDAYLPWVRTIVERFAEDPVVGTWEPIKGATEVDALTLRTFYDVVGGEIRRLDQHHLIESGTHGPWAYGSEENYALIHASAGLDVATVHDYDTGAVVPPNLEASLRAIAALDKPLVIAELGMLASPTGDPNQRDGAMVCLSFQDRRDALGRQFDAAFATPISGIDVWNWMPVRRDGCALTIDPADPMQALVRGFPLP